ncbi:hypothetical protein AX774_g2883 [Zancudomyces culisetae]|uniref:Uncharacterized protein n=1 Tax=Zancudomyces culisetae TaxID=1213189 RepID=A0A1R1PRM7_ZANCU|nr:hypothetical protein AX774_g2883 [Zancudomyces culisetae]|eukprot:OMH83608.1 hypothetical protein AX774_g2883 [Zancudomyces culisetae]
MWMLLFIFQPNNSFQAIHRVRVWYMEMTLSPITYHSSVSMQLRQNEAKCGGVESGRLKGSDPNSLTKGYLLSKSECPEFSFTLVQQLNHINISMTLGCSAIPEFTFDSPFNVSYKPTQLVSN